MLIMTFMALITAPLFEMCPADVDAHLAELNRGHADYAARIGALARASLGTPYAADPLGEGPGAEYDDDPLMDLSRADCVTYVEQIFALAAADSYRQAFDILQTIRYRGGEIAFENRNHFMVADWIPNNDFCRDITSELGVATQKVARTIGRRHFYTLKEIESLAETAVDEKITLEYVPASAAAEAEKKLPNGALILLIGNVDWLFTLHVGLYIRDDAGGGLFYHASSRRGKVVAEPFSEVFENSSRYIGFTAYETTSPAAR